MGGRKPQQRTDELIPQVLELRNQGLKLHQIAARFNLTKQRINQILGEHDRREAIMAEWGYPFSVRCLSFIEPSASATVTRHSTYSTKATSGRDVSPILG